MKRIIFHPGFPKCGSATIQHFLHINREKLYSDGILLPPFKFMQTKKGKIKYQYNKNNRYLAFAIHKHNNKERMCIPTTAMDSNFSEVIPNDHGLWICLLDKFNESGCSTLVISSELFCLEPGNYNFENIKPFFKEFEVKYTIFIRRLDRWIESMYCQGIRGVERLKCLIEDYEIYKNHFNHCFYKKIQYIEKNFPIGSFEVCSIDDLKKDENIISKFLDMASLNVSVLNNLNYQDNKNLSMPYEYYTFLRLLNIIELNSNYFRQISNALTKYNELDSSRDKLGAPVLMQPEQREKVLKLYLDDCRKINERYCSNISLNNFDSNYKKQPDKIEFTNEKASEILDNCRPYLNMSDDEINKIKNNLISYQESCNEK